MGIFDDAWKALDGLSQEAAKQAGPAAAEAWKQANKLGHEAAQRAGPAATEAWKNIDHFGQEAAKRATPAAAEVWKQAHRLGKELGNRATPLAQDAFIHAQLFAQSANQFLGSYPPGNAAGKATDWKFVQEFTEDIAQRLGSTADEVWTMMSSGNVISELRQHGFPTIDFPKIEFTEEGLSGFGEKLRAWILQHRKEFATLLACVAVAPVTVAITPAMLGLVGFTPLGIGAGTLASAAHSTIGPIASGSAFAILTSAGMGGYGLIVVQTIAASSMVTGTCSTAAVMFLDAMKEERCEHEKKE